jgi:signal transduction histidine kinase
MAALRPQPGTRRLLHWFIVVTLVPTAALVRLGWTVVEQGVSDERDRAAERLATSLRDVVVMLSDDLDRVVASSGAVEPRTADAAVVALDGERLRWRAGVTLPYYPAAEPRSPAAGEAFAGASRLEFRDGSLLAAARELTRLSGSGSASVRAEALLRLARVRAKEGALDRAFQTMDALEQLDHGVAGGLPAGFAASRSRVVLLTTAGRHDQASRAASRFAADLASGRWVVTYAEYEAARQLTESVPGATPPTGVGHPDASAIAKAAEQVLAAWHTRRSTEVPGSSTQVVHTSDGPAIVRTAISSSGPALLLVGPRAFQRLWADAIQGTGSVSFDFALTDADGTRILGAVDGASGRQTTLGAATTRLPWTVHAASRPGLNLIDLPSRARLMLAGIGIMTLVVLTSGYVLNRAISRELAVSRLQSDFVAAVSHEFRTPLTTIRQLSELLAGARVSSAARQQQYFETIVAESERLRQMVETLLDFGRMTSGRFEYRFGPVDVPALVNEVATAVMGDRPGSRVDVVTSGSPPAVHGDREALSRVFRNVLENAVKYSPADRHAWVAITGNAGRTTVEVRDRGLGIAAEEQRRIFEQFVRGTTASTAGIPGTGIGLAMAR